MPLIVAVTCYSHVVLKSFQREYLLHAACVSENFKLPIYAAMNAILLSGLNVFSPLVIIDFISFPHESHFSKGCVYAFKPIFYFPIFLFAVNTLSFAAASNSLTAIRYFGVARIK